MKRILLINILLTLVLGLGMGIGGWVLGTTHAQENSNVILACVDNLTGTVRIVATQSDCKPSETGSQWNVQGPQGIQGEQGLQGEPGATGSIGQTGAPGLSGYEVVHETAEMNPSQELYGFDDSARAECPEGKTIIGGGFSSLITDGIVEVVYSYPIANSWLVGVNTTQPIDITIYAICAFVEN